jgi:hypothetical protein
MTFECDHYNIPQQIDIAEPDAVSCGDDYSLVLAQGCLWICCDNDGIPGASGQGPRKLEYRNVVRMFACCNRFAVWRSGSPNVTNELKREVTAVTSGATVEERRITPSEAITMQNRMLACMPCEVGHVRSVGVSGTGDEDCCGLDERYGLWTEESSFFVYPLGKHLCSVVYWPPASCWVENTIMDIDSDSQSIRNMGRLIEVAGDRDRVLIMTEDAVYLTGDNTITFICQW